MDKYRVILEPGAGKSFWTVPGVFWSQERTRTVEPWLYEWANLFIKSFQFNIHKSLNKYFGKKIQFLAIFFASRIPFVSKVDFCSIGKWFWKLFELSTVPLLYQL